MECPKLISTKAITCEREAWIEIAARIGQNKWSHAGLCIEVAELEFNRFIDIPMYQDMKQRISLHMKASALGNGVYMDDFGVASTRILAALLLAEECS